jgi:hypothetical protein
MPEATDEFELLRVYLADRDVACPQCKYNLRNLAGANCPECGEDLRLRVSVLEPRQAAPITGLIFLTSGAGMNALLLLYAMIELFPRNAGSRGLDKFIWVNAVEFVVMGGAVALWLKQWRAVRALGPIRRWVVVGACALLTVADLIFFSKLIR